LSPLAQRLSLKLTGVSLKESWTLFGHEYAQHAATSSFFRAVHADLTDQLSLCLRDVGVMGHDLPTGPRVLAAVTRFQELHRELLRRGPPDDRSLVELLEVTGWRMSQLLADCLLYPEVISYVREADNLRRALRCGPARPSSARSRLISTFAINAWMPRLKRSKKVTRLKATAYSAPALWNASARTPTPTLCC
jgi:hypothetical protein